MRHATSNCSTYLLKLLSAILLWSPSTFQTRNDREQVLFSESAASLFTVLPYPSYHSMISLCCFIAISFVSAFFLHIPLIHVFWCHVALESVHVCVCATGVCVCMHVKRCCHAVQEDSLRSCCCTLALTSAGVCMCYSIHSITVVVGSIWSPQDLVVFCVLAAACHHWKSGVSSLMIICCCRS